MPNKLGYGQQVGPWLAPAAHDGVHFVLEEYAWAIQRASLIVQASGFLSRLRESLGKERPRALRRIGFAIANRCGFFVVGGIASFAAP